MKLFIESILASNASTPSGAHCAAQAGRSAQLLCDVRRNLPAQQWLLGVCFHLKQEQWGGEEGGCRARREQRVDRHHAGAVGPAHQGEGARHLAPPPPAPQELESHAAFITTPGRATPARVAAVKLIT